MIPSQRFASRVDRKTKATRGRTTVESTPIAIRSRVDLTPQFENRIRTRLASRLGHGATLIERGTVRFEDINGPRGGVDTVCRIKIVLSGRPSVQVEETASTPEAAFARAMPRVANAISRVRSKHGLRTGRERAERGHPPRVAATRAKPAAKRAAKPAAKRARPHTPRRATVVLEASTGRPSRKSTRKSANRAKPSARKARAVHARKMRPVAKASRAKSQRARARSHR